MSYKVELPAFAGPMDLLLYLIRQNEVDICDIPIAKITEQFVSYVEMLEQLDIAYAAEFLLMAATLMDIKARMLVPQTLEGEGEAEEELFDPRDELVRELLEYKKFHDAALYLGDRYEERGRRFESGADMLDPGEKPLEEIEIWDLFNAFGALLKQIGAGQVEIASTDVPVSAYMEMVVARLEESGRLAFSDFFSDLENRVALVGMFVALLELVRLQRIRAVQERDFGDICIELRNGDTAAPETSAKA